MFERQWNRVRDKEVSERKTETVKGTWRVYVFSFFFIFSQHKLIGPIEFTQSEMIETMVDNNGFSRTGAIWKE